MSICFQPGFFDVDERTIRLTKIGDPFVLIKEQIDWESFQAPKNPVYQKPRESATATKTILMPIKTPSLYRITLMHASETEQEIRATIQTSGVFVPTPGKDLCRIPNNLNFFQNHVT